MRNVLDPVGVSTMDSYLVPRWAAEWKRIIDVVKGYHPYADNYAAITPIPDIPSLRDDLRSVAPSLADFTDRLESHISAGGCGAFVPELCLSDFDDNTRACLVYALAVCIGDPTQTDHKNRRVIWDVTPRKTETDYFPTFSEHDQEAAFHTDAQYYPVPEKYFALYVMKPASCYGGRSTVCDARALRHAIEAKNKRWIIEELHQRLLPFRVPSAFTTTQDSQDIQATIAPIFSDATSIRYRRDTLLDGLRYFPEYGDSDIVKALDAFDFELKNIKVAAEVFMPKDSLMFIDNHTALHARTAFVDRSRHLLRIRLQKDENIPIKYEMLTVKKLPTEAYDLIA
ncbi:MAG: TauD/TfdA family dioxygenase [Glaciimonas sp.]|nr:TauD/TfdA family dioxygenase [Glaciimonas sp.]